MAKDRPFNNPFAAVGKDLKRQIKKDKKQKLEQMMAPPPPKRPRKPAVSTSLPPDEDSGADIFASAMAGAKPLDADARGRAQPALPPSKASGVPVHDEDAEALAEFASLVDGPGTFDVSESEEFIEGCAQNLDRKLLRKLKRGDFTVQARLDLHGLTRETAEDAVERFLEAQAQVGRRCVLIVHGRGLGSKGDGPVLKGLISGWLEHGRIARSILAFCSAKPQDGGTGAIYVLLRQNRRAE